MVMASGVSTKGGMSMSKVDPCGVFRLRVKANSVLCLQCWKWIHGRYAGGKGNSKDVENILHAEDVKGMLERQWSRTKSYVMKWKR